MLTEKDNQRVNFRPLCPKSDLPFYRTGSPQYWSKEDVLYFRKTLGITHFYDLRTEFEQGKCFYCQNLREGALLKHISAPVDLTGDPFFSIGNASALDYANYYIRMLPHAISVAERLIDHAEKLIDGEKILFGCAAGKDRTGVVAMVLLKKYGVDDEQIIEDYMESIHIEDRFLELFYNETIQKTVEPETFVSSMRPKACTIEIVLDHITMHGLL